MYKTFIYLYHLIKLIKNQYLKGFHVDSCDISIKKINKYAEIINVNLEIIFFPSGMAIIEKKWYLDNKNKKHLLDSKKPPPYLLYYFVGYPHEILGHGDEFTATIVCKYNMDEKDIIKIKTGEHDLFRIKKELKFICKILNKMVDFGDKIIYFTQINTN